MEMEEPMNTLDALANSWMNSYVEYLKDDMLSKHDKEAHRLR